MTRPASTAAPTRLELTIPPETAVFGRSVTAEANAGRRLKVSLPAGMRTGEKVRAGD